MLGIKKVASILGNGPVASEEIGFVWDARLPKTSDN
jgi:hypothetical protein